jgi:hypothetical protein
MRFFMSVDKTRLHELIELISEEKLEEVVVILQDYAEKKESDSLFAELLKNPIKVENFSKFNREELYER